MLPGALCSVTGYDAPSGSLERRLLRRSIELHPSLYRSFGLSYSHVRKSGSLVVAWSDADLHKLSDVLRENAEAGDTEAQVLSEVQLRGLEPSLSKGAKGAVLCPREAVVDPFLVGIGYAESCLRHGVTVLPNTTVTEVQRGQDGLWGVVSRRALQRPLPTWKGDGRSRDGELLARVDDASETSDGPVQVHRGRVIVNAAGLFGDVIESFRLLGSSAATPSLPRISQPLTDISEPSTTVSAPATAANDPPSACSQPSTASPSLTATSPPLSAVCEPSTAVTPPPIASGPPFQIRPRKGQFLVIKPTVTSPAPPSHVIEQVATQFTKGVIVWTTVYGNVLIGPTADEVDSSSDRSTDHGTVEMLARRGAEVLGLVNEVGESGIRTLQHNGYHIVGTYSGIRPATNHRDYQIYAIPKHNWITVGGIRSTGLTASPGIGEYVGELYRQMAMGGQGGDQSGSAQLFRALGEGAVCETRLKGVTECATTSGCAGSLEYAATPPRVVNGTVPTLRELAEEYRRRGDGKVTVYGREWVVTHPIASFGMETYDGASSTS